MAEDRPSATISFIQSSLSARQENVLLQVQELALLQLGLQRCRRLGSELQKREDALLEEVRALDAIASSTADHAQLTLVAQLLLQPELPHASGEGDARDPAESCDTTADDAADDSAHDAARYGDRDGDRDRYRGRDRDRDHDCDRYRGHTRDSHRDRDRDHHGGTAAAASSSSSSRRPQQAHHHNHYQQQQQQQQQQQPATDAAMDIVSSVVLGATDLTTAMTSSVADDAVKEPEPYIIKAVIAFINQGATRRFSDNRAVDRRTRW